MSALTGYTVVYCPNCGAETLADVSASYTKYIEEINLCGKCDKRFYTAGFINIEVYGNSRNNVGE